MSASQQTWIGTGRDYPHHKSTTTDEQVAARWRRAGCEVEGPYVPAERLQVAVEALREISRVLDGHERGEPFGDDEVGSLPVLPYVQDAARDALTALGESQEEM